MKAVLLTLLCLLVHCWPAPQPRSATDHVSAAKAVGNSDKALYDSLIGDIREAHGQALLDFSSGDYDVRLGGSIVPMTVQPNTQGNCDFAFLAAPSWALS